MCSHVLLKAKYLSPSSPNDIIIIVVGVIKMGNIVPRAGLEHTSLAFLGSLLPLYPDVTIIPMPTRLCSSLPQTTTLLLLSLLLLPVPVLFC